LTESKCECPKCNCDKEIASVQGPARYEIAKKWMQDPEKKDLVGPLLHDLLCEDCFEGLHVGLENKQERI